MVSHPRVVLDRVLHLTAMRAPAVSFHALADQLEALAEDDADPRWPLLVALVREVAAAAADQDPSHRPVVAQLLGMFEAIDRTV